MTTLQSIQVVRKWQLLPNNTAQFPAGQTTVLSVQPDGTIATRPAGTADVYEVFEITDKGLLYSPSGNSGPSFLVPYVD